MSKPDVSVIVPAFNTADVISKTLDCLIDGQFGACSADAWEIIVVDDGSTDGLEDVVRAYVERYPSNVKLLSQDNAGVSVARNHAMDFARGRYLFFMDSDDLLLGGSLPKLAEFMDRKSLDLVRFGFESISAEDFDHMTVCDIRALAPLSETNTFMVDAGDFLEQTRGMLLFRGLWSACLSMFRSDFVASAGSRFIPGLHIGEDCMFVWNVMLHNPRMAVVNEDIYLYRISSMSATNKATVTHLRRRVDSLRMLVDLQGGLLSCENPMLGFEARSGIRESMTYNLQDIITARVALDDPLRELLRDLREFRTLGGVVDPTAGPFIHKNASYTPVTRFKAWLITVICKRAQKKSKS